MIRLSKLADYGIVMTAHLAQDQGQASTQEIAAATGIPQPMASKILKLLARADLLRSRRGAHGGYELARPAGEISVAQIIEALEGPIALTECVDETGGCGLELICQARTNWPRINDAIREALEEISLAEMAAGPAAAALVEREERGIQARA